MDYTLDFLTSETVYDLSESNCYAFRHGTDKVDGLSLALGNMVSGFSFTLGGVPFFNSESAYIAGLFSDGSDSHLDIQRMLAAETNGFMAKKRIRRANEEIGRNDWEEFNVMWMLYVVWCKCAGNEAFRNLLLSFPADAVIIEDSTFQRGATATFWGARNQEQRIAYNALSKMLKRDGMKKSRRKAVLDSHRLDEWRNIGKFIGCNCMGKILMLCRDALMQGSVPPINMELLRSKNINLLGTVLAFDSLSAVSLLENRA